MREISLRVRVRLFCLPLAIGILSGLSTIVFSVLHADPQLLEHSIIFAQSTGMMMYVLAVPLSFVMAEGERGERIGWRMAFNAVSLPLLAVKLPRVFLEIFGGPGPAVIALLVIFLATAIYVTKHFFPEYCES